MMEGIRKKQQLFLKRIGGNPMGKKKVNGISKLQWIQTSYALDGGALTAEDVRLILSGRYGLPASLAVPRTRGGDPLGRKLSDQCRNCSPHTRG